jgi:hypothetical protein
MLETEEDAMVTIFKAMTGADFASKRQLRPGACIEPMIFLLMAFSFGSKIQSQAPFLDTASAIDLIVLVLMGYMAGNTVASAICSAKEGSGARSRVAR